MSELPPENDVPEDEIGKIVKLTDYIKRAKAIKELADRHKEKKDGVGIVDIKDAIRERERKKKSDAESEQIKLKQADMLIGFAEKADLFHTPDSTCYADIILKDHRETWPIRARGFRRWLSHCYYEATSGAPSSEALTSALNVLEARAHFDAKECSAHVRVAGHDGKIYLDLADDGWQAIEIDRHGWRVVDRPPVRFRRAAGMLPLPLPHRKGDLGKLSLPQSEIR